MTTDKAIPVCDQASVILHFQTGLKKNFDDLIATGPTDTFFYAPFKNMPKAVDAR
jgi:hypothetical protein